MASDDVTTASPADRHRLVAGSFEAIAAGADPSGWDAPAPVDGWAARDVVRHLTTWFPGFLAGGSDIVLLAGPSVDDDPVESWRVHAAQVQAVLDDPQTAERMFRNPHTGDLPLAEAIDRFYTADVFMHSWDLAAATGQAPELDEAYAAQLLAGMEPIDEMLRASGQYGARIDVPEDATTEQRLAGFIGRDPFWTAPGGASA
ncbi:TIGR03086 family metal-binding protein [Herbiconiux sp. CPCC 203407]|uniref:TIGR03086 family metal-binding protein n=1 Tax=Herbiconiux oxytropis TaxID=2970915 RepID=A0AA41XHB3_9MICO|nr:TIGR03086 family metal-binding protein [Herbiconiux oxytropis]MCS5722523.1 TIGR03086 family metal-binding protein [Herbiconiux oxytropis]MCS5726463.1 TIGR03086 family metal-binding protein [Herbiconiux oxytropis]